jgi:hypothetical protein
MDIMHPVEKWRSLQARTTQFNGLGKVKKSKKSWLLKMIAKIEQEIKLERLAITTRSKEI